MNQRSRITGHTAPTTTPTIPARRLIAAGVKRGNGRLVITEVAA